MRFAFFHIGKDVNRARIFCKSVKRVFGDKALIIQISDLETPKAEEAGKILRSRKFKKDQLMYWRMVGYRDLLKHDPAPTVFFDTDILITKRFKIDFDKSPFLCERSYQKFKELSCYAYINSVKVSFREHENKKLGELYPFVGCFYADKDCLFLEEAIKIYNSLGRNYQFWFGDQIALREAARIIPFSSLPESVVACSPHKYTSGQKNAIAVHFKGGGNKAGENKLLMEKIFSEISAGSI